MKAISAVSAAALLVAAFGASNAGTTPGSRQLAPSASELNRGIAHDASISSANVRSLVRTWSVPTTDMVSHKPLVAGNKVYFADWAGTVYAVDERDGGVIWRKNIESPRTDWPWHGFAGTGALGEGKLFEASVEGNAFALDQQTGQVLWKARVTDQPTGGNLSRLLYHDGLVYLGLQSVDEPLSAKMPKLTPSFQGRVLALDARTGKTVWEFKTVEGADNGVAVWSSFALDTQTNTLYFNTGNNYTGNSTRLSDSMVAVDATTGKEKWHYQVTQNDLWTKAQQVGPDYDFGAGPQLFEARINGRLRKLVGAGQKSGFYTVFDRATGQHVWSAFVGYGAIGGGIRGEASILDNRILVWSNDNYLDGKPPGDFPITVKALDPATGRTLWNHDKAQPAIGFAAGVAANDVYFVGSLDGTVKAYRSTDGSQLWSYTLPSSVGGSLTADDSFLFVTAGLPESFGGSAATNGLFAFSIGASATPASGSGGSAR